MEEMTMRYMNQSKPWGTQLLTKIPLRRRRRGEDVTNRNPRFFVAVHVGAGFLAPSNEKALRSAMKRACLAAASVLRKGGDPSINAGRGSNLTEDGHVECDASVMDGDTGSFGAVGAVPVAALLAKEQMLGSALLGRMPPMYDYTALVTERAKRQWEKYKSMLDDAKAVKIEIDGELSSSTQEDAAVSVKFYHVII
ncbi:unnamed protein product [Camellia sinensis]